MYGQWEVTLAGEESLLGGARVFCVGAIYTSLMQLSK